MFDIGSIVAIVNACNTVRDEYKEDNIIATITFKNGKDDIYMYNKEFIYDDILNSDIVRIHNERTFRTGLGMLILVI